MAVTFTQAEIDSFRDFMLKNRGVTEMWLGDRHYKFSSLHEMREHLASMERSLTGSTTPKTRYGATKKGLY